MKLQYIVFCWVQFFSAMLGAMVLEPFGGEICVRCAGLDSYALLGPKTKIVFCLDASDKTIDIIVAQAPNIEELRFMVTNNTITDKTLIKIAQLKNLKSLFFFPPSSISSEKWEINTVVTDKGFAALAALINLKKFALFGFCNVSNIIGRVIGQWRTLEYLHICCCVGLTDAMLVHVTRLEMLKRLIWYSSISNEGLRCIAYLKKLQVLVLADCSALTTEGFSHLQLLPLLKSLTMCDVHALNDYDMHIISELKQLEVFDFLADNDDLHDQGLAFLKKCHKLKMINLTGFKALTDDSLKHCLDIASLRRLRIMGSPRLTVNALLDVYSRVTNVDVYIEPLDFIGTRECLCSTNF